MGIYYIEESDIPFILSIDSHISREMLLYKIKNKEIFILKDEQSKCIGYLRYNYFWDNIPFMNLLYIADEYRNKGYGKRLVLFWEQEMKNKGYHMVMTSTLSNESAQHFYRKMGYIDSGSLLLDGEALEIIFKKTI